MSEELNTTPESQPVEAAPVEAPNFLDSLPEDIRGDASLANFKDSAGLAKSYLESRKLIGASVRIPTEDTSPEATADFYSKLQGLDGVVKLPNAEDTDSVNSFYNKLGRPEAADGYKLNEEIQIDEDQFGAFSEIAHKAGLTNEQMNEVIRFDAQRQQDEADAFQASQANGEQVLKEKWGNDYQARLDGAKAAAKTYSDMYPDAMQELINGPSGNNPALLAMLSELQGTMVEKGTAGKHASQPYGTSSEEAQIKIQEIRSNSSHPYNNPNDSKNAAALKRMEELYNIAYPSK